VDWIILKRLVRSLLRLLYRVEVHGLEHYFQLGNPSQRPCLIVANHQSFLDPVLLWAFLPGPLTFAINTQIARRAWVRPFLRFARVFPLDTQKASALKEIIRQLKLGYPTVIFPEGRITVTGTLMKIYDGPGMVADRAGAKVLPVRIDGAHLTPFARSKVRRRLFPKITLYVLPPREICPPPEVKGSERRKQAGARLADLMAEMLLATTPVDKTLFAALLEASRLHGRKKQILEDIERRPLTYLGLIARILGLAERIDRHVQDKATLGILLPSTTSTVAVLFATQFAGRLPAMLNYTSGARGVVGACLSGKVGAVITSRRFIAQAALEETLAALAEHKLPVYYLEDWALEIHGLAKFKAFLYALTASWWYRFSPSESQKAAVMLFTSGSEGVPKAVLLSHRNLLSNCAQLGAVLDFGSRDRVLNVLPLFHVFGLNIGLLLPLTSGIYTFLYPNPLHYKVVPELAYELNATVLFGTNTFLAGYGKAAHPYDFYSLRYVFAGAEKLQEDVRQLWMERFGLRILEGYGATETSPVLAVNTPMYYRAGTVGRFLPGVEWRLEAVAGLPVGGRLHVRGPNVMLGYYLPEREELIPPASSFGVGWYDTGDVVSVDAEGFVSILGRTKRFAKVAGEMVALAEIEKLAAKVWPGYRHAAVAVADERRGERIVLVSEYPGAELSALHAAARTEGVPELWLPKKVLFLQPFPLLGSGKVDYFKLAELIE
jgi:acyl-[acyl-carrier-protein]-phospholipid O-acyltransferase/long-chain-fatty-acid--[acyl-carrier-protein] ligase